MPKLSVEMEQYDLPYSPTVKILVDGEQLGMIQDIQVKVNADRPPQVEVLLPPKGVEDFLSAGPKASLQNTRDSLKVFPWVTVRQEETTRKSPEECAEILQAAEMEVLSVFRHLKSGDLYYVTEITLRESDVDPTVTYRPVVNPKLAFSRPLSEFRARYQSTKL